MELSYLIDNIDLKDFGITVSESRGLLDLPQLKTPLKVDWPDYNGDVVDLEQRRVTSREIELKCWMKAAGKVDFASLLNNFLEIFQKPGTRRLTVNIHPDKPLLYEVYNETGAAIEKQWNEGLMVGTFALKLKEPDPVKRIIRHRRTGEETKTLTIKMTTTKALTIHWGDGKRFYDTAPGENKLSAHDYTADGTFYAIISGVIEDIKDFSTNGTIIWNRL
jgi:hypothetical protein